MDLQKGLNELMHSQVLVGVSVMGTILSQGGAIGAAFSFGAAAWAAKTVFPSANGFPANSASQLAKSGFADPMGFLMDVVFQGAGAVLGLFWAFLIINEDFDKTMMANALGSNSEWFNALMINIGMAYGLSMWNARFEWADTTAVQYAMTWFTWALMSFNVDRVGMNAASSGARILWAAIRDNDSIADSSKDYIWLWLAVPSGAAIAWTLLETKVVVPLMGGGDKNGSGDHE